MTPSFLKSFNSKKITILFVLHLFFISSLLASDNSELLSGYLWNKVIATKPPNRPKVALVLGGGGARGLAHIGVLRVFKEENIPIDMVVGTSVGALMGALYCSGQSIDTMEDMVDNIGWSELTDYSGPALLKMFVTKKLLSTKKMEKFLTKSIGDVRFEDLKIPFVCIATDILTGERVIFNEGDVIPAVRASATVPGIFEPVEYRHRFLVDGGLVDNIPCDAAKAMGADIIIAVSVQGDFSRNRMSNIFMLMYQSTSIQGKLLDEKNLRYSDYVITPDVGDVSGLDLGRSQECIKAGIIAAKKSAPQIKRLIIERSPDALIFN